MLHKKCAFVALFKFLFVETLMKLLMWKEYSCVQLIIHACTHFVTVNISVCTQVVCNTKVTVSTQFVHSPKVIICTQFVNCKNTVWYCMYRSYCMYSVCTSFCLCTCQRPCVVIAWKCVLSVSSSKKTLTRVKFTFDPATEN